jgi:hypothetical protein
MSKINGDKARQNLRDRKSTKMRERLAGLAKAANRVRARHLAEKKAAAAAEAKR